MSMPTEGSLAREDRRITATASQTPLLTLSDDQQWSVIDAARDRAPVAGLTHNFYRYPARFPPQMVRAVIDAFTQPGDLVLDPYMGGATTLVEALANGRRAIGTDVSTLATFLAQVKTTILTEQELAEVATWTEQAVTAINMTAPEPSFPAWAKDGYFKHLDRKPYWRLRKAMAQSVAATAHCRNLRIERFARCSILRAAQWALDGRRSIPTVEEFREALIVASRDMVAGIRELRNSAGPNQQEILCLNRSAIGLDDEPAVRANEVKLVMTSPPYPGVHVLYHRWQVGGRKETGAPFWIANSLDGSGSSFYTMGDRKGPHLNRYFETITSSLRSVASVCAADAVIVQVVAFAQPEWQLPRYLDAAESAGLKEARLSVLAGAGDGRLWRSVPNRRWHAIQKGPTGGSNEVMFFHGLDPSSFSSARLA